MDEEEPVGGERWRGPKREAGLGLCERGSIFRERLGSFLLSRSTSLVGDDARSGVRFAAGAKATLVPAGLETARANSSATARRSLSSWYRRRDSNGRTPFSRYTRSVTRFWTASASWEVRSSLAGEGGEILRILRIIKKTRLCRYESRSSFLVSRREMPSSGRAMSVEVGRESRADERDSVSVASSSGCAIIV